MAGCIYIHKMIKTLILWISCAVFFSTFGLWGVTEVQSAKLIDRIVAVVNDEIIPLSELNYLLIPYLDKIKESGYPPEKQKEMAYKIRGDLLDQLISRKLTDQEVKRVRISVSAKEIDGAIERVKERGFLTDEDLRAGLSQQGLTMEKYRENLKEQILRAKLVNLEVRSKVIITDEDIAAYYKKHYDQYRGEKKYHLRNIIMKTPTFGGAEGKKRVLEKMEEIHEKLTEGESFESLARAYSESSLAGEGGDLGQFGIESLSPQLQEAIKGLSAGDFTSVLETDQGLQLFYIQNIIMTPGQSVKEVSSEIEEKIFSEIINEKYKAWTEALRKKSHIKIIK